MNRADLLTSVRFSSGAYVTNTGPLLSVPRQRRSS
jgi:hypothetical protein